MTVTTILGSPRRNGNTARLLRQFEQLVIPSHTVTRIDLADYSLQGCLGCDACQAEDASFCSQDDDIARILRQLVTADVVLYASPVYAWGFSAQMKALLDRHYCLVKWGQPAHRSGLYGKPVMSLLSCGGRARENADLPQEMFRRQAAYLQCEVVGQYVLDNCSAASDLLDRGRAIARKMTEDLAALARRSR